MAQLICIVCPKGCHLTVDEKTLQVKGNSCEKGADYGVAELTRPVRVLTSTVKVTGSSQRRCPVKTNLAIPKGEVMSVMHQINEICLAAPISTGQIIIKNVCNTGADIVATKDIGAF